MYISSFASELTMDMLPEKISGRGVLKVCLCCAQHLRVLVNVLILLTERRDREFSVLPSHFEGPRFESRPSGKYRANA